MNQRLLLVIKIVGSVLLVWWIVARADWGAVAGALVAANRLEVLLVAALMVFCVSFSAYKWRLLLRLHGAPFSFAMLHRWYFIAMFFNNFLPTSIGGDGFRIFRTMDNERSKTTAFVAVFVERMSGIVSLLALGYAASMVLVLTGGVSGVAMQLARSVAVFGSTALIVLFAATGLMFIAVNARRWLIRRAWPQKLVDVAHHVHDYVRQPGMGLWLIGVSFAFHILSVAWMVLLCHAIGADIGFLEMTIIAALLSVVSILPLSINGIGLLDGSFILLAGIFGLSNSEGLTFMLIMRAVLIVISIVGAGLYIVDRRQRGLVAET